MFAVRKIYNPYQDIKPANHYTEEEIISLIESEKNPYLYDYLIDRLYFYRPDKRNTKNAYTYSFLMARQEEDRRRREISIEEFPYL